jgi:Uri superfamily endonuclease
MQPDQRPGTYALVFICNRPVRLPVGRLGQVDLAAGYWIYVGSAFGPGGLRSRLIHHLTPSQRPHWHLDHIKSVLQPIAIWATTDTVKREHAWATQLAGLKGSSRPIAGFGATDCGCRAHLIHRSRRPGFFSFQRRLRQEIPRHGPLFRFDPPAVVSGRIPR